MSVPNQTPYNIYTANGLTTVFTYEFYIISASDLQVSINGNVATNGYSVTGVGNKDGGDITFLTPPANGAVVMLERVVPTFRLTDYQDNGDLLADTVNKDFDRIWMAIQRAFIDLGFALTRPYFGGPFDAKGYRIANLDDPRAAQDAVNNRSMRSYVDAAIAGVVGGFGWFIQYGAGAVYRTFQDKMRDNVSVLDFVAKADVAAITSGAMDATAAFTAAATASPGGVYVPAGTYLIPADIPGKFWGPGKRIQTVAEGTIPFTNPSQTHGNLILGYDAGKNFVGDDIDARVVLLGPGAGRNITTGTNITASGHGAISGDTLVDALTDTSPCTGTELIAIGVNALKKAITLNNSIGIGRDALNENKFGSFNVGIGSSSFQQLHTGSNNVGVGRATGMRAGIVTDSSGKRLSFNVVNGCTFIGNAAGREITSGDNNTYVGNNTGRGVTSTTNTFTGTATGANNVAVGADALNAVGTASNNVMLGRGAGRKLSSGNGNIFIGDLAGAGVSSGDNQLIIANQGSLPFLQGLMGPVADANNYARFDASVQPATDNVRACGSSSRRWSVIFAGTGTINTSDGTAKIDIVEIEEAERRVATKLKGMIRRFKFTDAVEEKGGRARLHFGVIAQDVQQAFAEEGLNASDYGLFCYDEWEDQYQTIPAEMVYHPAVKSSLVSPDGEQLIIEEEQWEVIKPAERVLIKEAGGRYGIRYEELLCFIIAAM